MDPILGEIKLFAGNFAPEGWLICDGRLLPVNSYAALYSLLQNTYGGTPNISFNLPDLRGAFPTQCGASSRGSYSYGQVGGSQSITISGSNLPPHSHNIIKGSGTNLTGSVSVATTVSVNNTDTNSVELPVIGSSLSAVKDLGGSGGAGIYNSETPNTPLNGATANSTVTNSLNFDPTGLLLTTYGTGPSPISIVPNFVAMQYIISTAGSYPVRP